ncbi:MAG: ATP-dependent Clp protease proteolytic subunit [Candidatus Thermoplasmatota archaeon]|jgi:membrane-bound serine protease (ClpP class)|nr:ATP-dependent Clp protease proteolytic subunit [Candidatus Thermoplasmatota archaeon]MCL5963544.1 ATP-dependent Clp protease proteolytic subunit [Candidatus Thermoplasmatota archaeon]
MFRFNKIIYILLLYISIASFISVINASAVSASSSHSVVIINFDYGVDPGAVNYFHQTLSYAVQNNDPVIIIMNTPGGYLSSAFSIVNSIQNAESTINVITYIPPGDMGASAGSFIAMASNYIYMGNGSFIGPSQPYIIGGSSGENQHVINAAASYMKSLALEHHRNVSAVATMVYNNTAYTDVEAYNLSVINGISNSLNDVLAKSGYSNYALIQYTENVYQQFESFISNSIISGFFILIGSIAIMLDIYHGSIYLTVVGVIALAIGFWGSQLINGSVVGLLLIIIGVALIFVEVKLGHGAAMAAGVGMVITGSIITVYGITYSSRIYFPFMNIGSYIIIVLEATVIPIGALYLIKLREVAMKKPKLIGPDIVKGKTGTAMTDIEVLKEGVVNVMAEDWSAISDSPIKKGEHVKVVEYVDGKVRVKKI